MGVAQTELVLKCIKEVRLCGLGVIFITHNVRHAHAVGDRFTGWTAGERSNAARAMTSASTSFRS